MNIKDFSDKVKDGDLKLDQPKQYKVDTSRDFRYVADPSFDVVLRKERIERNLT